MNKKLVKGFMNGSIEKTYDDSPQIVLEKFIEERHKNSVRDYNVGKSDYSKHKIQPWDIWIEYKLNPFDADIVKRVLREKDEPGMSKQESRKLDYQKIVHICQERIRQIEEGIEL